MSVETYRLLHVVGALALFLGLGGMLSVGKDGQKPAALYPILHGIGLLVMLVAGVGVLHKAGLGFPAWASAKAGAWLLLAVLPVLVKKGLLPRAIAALVVLGLGLLAAWLGVMKAI
ncbi:MAG: hypothetical protein RL398_3081 [Planctomycetota bacterium]|jgi:hypothetical protein